MRKNLHHLQNWFNGGANITTDYWLVQMESNDQQEIQRTFSSYKLLYTSLIFPFHYSGNSYMMSLTYYWLERSQFLIVQQKQQITFQFAKTKPIICKCKIFLLFHNWVTSFIRWGLNLPLAQERKKIVFWFPKSLLQIDSSRLMIFHKNTFQQQCLKYLTIMSFRIIH